MRRNNLTWSAVPLALVLLASSAFAQQPAETGPALNGALGNGALGNGALGNTVAQNSEDDLQARQANQAWSDMLRELQMLRAELHSLQNAVDGMQKNHTAIQDGLLRQLDINQRLEKQISELDYRVQLAATGSGGSNASNNNNFVRSIQDDPKLREDFRRVIQGKIIFENQTGKPQRVFINGAEWEVITGRSSMLVPYGRVTIHTRMGNDNNLTPFQLDNWTQENDLLVLNVPLLETPQTPTPAQ